MDSASLFRLIALFVSTIVLTAVYTTASSSEESVYGPRVFEREQGEPTPVSEEFVVNRLDGAFTLIVENGLDGNNRVSSGSIDINGRRVVEQSDFNQQVDSIQKRVSLEENNEITVTLASEPKSLITVSILGVYVNTAPVANAGGTPLSIEGKKVTLDGSNSNDPDGDPLTYAWTLTKPQGSSAVLDDSTIVQPSYTVDFPGDYVATLVVTDPSGESSSDVVSFVYVNRAPVADAGEELLSVVGDLVTLDGSKSYDQDGDPLTFSWSLSTPQGSSAVLDDTTATNPSYTIDISGEYIATLVVTDPAGASSSDDVAFVRPSSVILTISSSKTAYSLSQSELPSFTATAYNSGSDAKRICHVPPYCAAYVSVYKNNEKITPLQSGVMSGAMGIPLRSSKSIPPGATLALPHILISRDAHPLYAHLHNLEFLTLLKDFHEGVASRLFLVSTVYGNSTGLATENVYVLEGTGIYTLSITYGPAENTPPNEAKYVETLVSNELVIEIVP